MDYIFNNFNHSHKKLGTPNSAFSAFMETSFLLTCNLIVGHVIYYLISDSVTIKLFNYAFVFTGICFINYFRFLYKKKHEDKYHKYLNKKSKIKDRLVVFYVIATVISTIIAIILMRYQIVGHF